MVSGIESRFGSLYPQSAGGIKKSGSVNPWPGVNGHNYQPGKNLTPDPSIDYAKLSPESLAAARKAILSGVSGVNTTSPIGAAPKTGNSYLGEFVPQNNGTGELRPKNDEDGSRFKQLYA